MKIKEIDDLVSKCTEYLEKTKGTGELLESYLNQLLVVKIYKAFEEQIKELIIKRAEKSNDPEIVSYFKSNHRRFQGILTSDIQDKILKKFSQACYEEFKKKVACDNIGQSFNSIISNRHNVVHSCGTIYATFNDTIEAYNIGHKVLDILSEVFGLNGDK